MFQDTSLNNCAVTSLHHIVLLECLKMFVLEAVEKIAELWLCPWQNCPEKNVSQLQTENL